MSTSRCQEADRVYFWQVIKRNLAKMPSYPDGYVLHLVRPESILLGFYGTDLDGRQFRGVQFAYLLERQRLFEKRERDVFQMTQQFGIRRQDALEADAR